MREIVEYVANQWVLGNIMDPYTELQHMFLMNCNLEITRSEAKQLLLNYRFT